MKSMSWISGSLPQELMESQSHSMIVYAQLRSRDLPQSGRLYVLGNGYKIEFDEFQYGVAQGQILVVYSGNNRNECIGSGEICEMNELNNIIKF